MYCRSCCGRWPSWKSRGGIPLRRPRVYRRLLDLWSDADARVRGQVAAAERASARLAFGERQ